MGLGKSSLCISLLKFVNYYYLRVTDKGSIFLLVEQQRELGVKKTLTTKKKLTEKCEKNMNLDITIGGGGAGSIEK